MMSNPDAEQPRSPLPEEQPSPALQPGKPLDPLSALKLISSSAELLFRNGQSTERMIEASERLARALAYRGSVFPRWGELAVQIEDDAGSRHEIVAALPAGMDMSKVTATMAAIDKVCDGRMDAPAMRSTLESINRLPPVSIARFALLAAAGAAALGVIFGTTHVVSLVLIALTAGIGACLRRWLAGVSHNLFIQPLCAALFAGVIGAIAFRLQLSSSLRLVAVCPCMVLVPGPHFLNGMIDLARARIALGAARIGYASLITLMICTGLLLGLALVGESLPASGTSHSVPLGYDVIAAGIAVAAYGTFFAMPWQMLPIPVLIGMLAHASRWGAISVAGASAESRSVGCLPGGRSDHHADRRPYEAAFCGGRIRFGGITDPRCVSISNGRGNGRPGRARRSGASGALGPDSHRRDNSSPHHPGDGIRLDLSENVHPIFHSAIVSPVAAMSARTSGPDILGTSLHTPERS